MAHKRFRLGGRELVPEHLREHGVPLSTAAQVSGYSMTHLWREIHAGRLRATPYRSSGKAILWQVGLGDLAEYTGTPLSEKGLELIERWRAWKAGEEIAEVA